MNTARNTAGEMVGLRYCNDNEPGLRRRRAGKGFRYLDENGRLISNVRTLDRIKSLAIPPAWTDVWIAPRSDGHIQATGRDAKGRKQYRYHPQWTACRDEVKYSNLVAFARTLPDLRKRIEADMGLRGLPRERVLASVVWLLDHALIRVGNAAYARENGSFGLTTLRDRHVDVRGSRLRFVFRGKSGKEWKLTITDRRIARIVKGAQDLPGQHLFQYLDESGQRHSIGSENVNAYIRERSGGDFSSKHFRTWAGTVEAANLLKDTDRPETRHETARALNHVIDKVAASLGNTRSICRKCYIHPAVLDAWDDGRLSSELESLGSRRTPKRYSSEEFAVLRWLEKRQRRSRGSSA